MSCSATNVVPGSRPLVALEHLESVKWFAAVVMLIEHYYRYVVGDLPAGVYAVGRVVFPLFVLALVCGLCDASRQTYARVLRRMGWWFVVSMIAAMSVRSALPLNVIGTLGLGLVAARAWGVRAWGVVVACAGLGWFCEFGAAGVLAVVAASQMCGTRRGESAAWGAAALGLVCVANGDLWALLAVPLVGVLRWADVRIPRVRHAFYVVYALQFPAFVLMRGL